jgi:hypothetical protein
VIIVTFFIAFDTLQGKSSNMQVFVCVCVCVCERERERERDVIDLEELLKL